MMKKLLPLALIAVACEAMAQDAQCVRERAAMVENIQAYARSDLSLLGPQGISESVLEAVRQKQERIDRSIANRLGDRLNLGEDLWILSGYSGEPMPKGIAARIRFASGRARSAALSAVGMTGHDLCLRAHD